MKKEIKSEFRSDIIILVSSMLLILVIYFSLIGWLYIPIRLYFIGELREEIVKERIYCKGEGAYEGLSLEAESRVNFYNPNIPEAITTGWCAEEGDKLYIKFSEKMNEVVVVDTSYGLLSTIRAYQGRLVGATFLFYIILVLFLSIKFLKRFYHILGFLIDTIKLNIFQPFTLLRLNINTISILSQQVLKICVIILGISFVTLFYFFLWLGLTFVESYHEIIIGLYFSFSIVFFFSKIPEKIINTFITATDKNLKNTIMQAIRNLLTSVVCFKAVINIISFMSLSDIRKFETIWELFYSLIQAIFSI